ncbi:MAG: VOC family protein [Vulcanimicrobiaceae bacterium]
MYVSIVTVRVKDVDRAIDFYTNKLGWEKTMDVPMGENRWVTVAPKGAQTSFTLSTYSPDGSEHKGGLSGVVLEVDNVYDEQKLLEQRGVKFTETARTEPWGGWAVFADSEGNEHGLHSNVPAAVGSNGAP